LALQANPSKKLEILLTSTSPKQNASNRAGKILENEEKIIKVADNID
jgi:hypothetical protein